MKLYNIDNITEPKVPFRGFRGNITALKVPFRGFRGGLSILLLVMGMFASPLYGQEIFNRGERQPFDAQPAVESGQLLRAPSLVGPGLPPPGEDDKVGGVPVEDAVWLLPLMAVGYGVYRRRTPTPKSPEGDLGE